MAALAFLAIAGVALLPRAFASDAATDDAFRPAPDFLQRYSPDAGLAAICREPEILGEAHGLCGLGGVKRTGYRAPAPPTKDIRFATEGPPGPEAVPVDTPAIDHWDIGFSQLPAMALPDAGSGAALGGGFAASGGGGGIGGFAFVGDGGNGNGGPPPFGEDCDPETDPECDGDSDSEPPEKAVPEPSAALLFGLGFVAVLRRQSRLR